MKKILYTLITILIGFVLLCGCDPKNPEDEIVKLNIHREGAVKFEFLPTDWPVTNGGETTDQDLIYEIINKLNEQEYHEAVVDGIQLGVGKKVRITYVNGNTIEFNDAGVNILKSDGTWLKRTNSEFDLQDYLVKKLNFKLDPDKTRLNVPEEGVVGVSYILTRLPDLDVGELKDLEELKHIVSDFNMVDFYVCSTYRTEFPEPSGYLVIRYADGSVMKYADAENFIQRPDGVWLEHQGSTLAVFLANYFGLSYDTVYGTN